MDIHPKDWTHWQLIFMFPFYVWRKVVAWKLVQLHFETKNWRCQPRPGNNLVSLVELTRLAASLGISSPNVAKLFADRAGQGGKDTLYTRRQEHILWRWRVQDSKRLQFLNIPSRSRLFGVNFGEAEILRGKNRCLAFLPQELDVDQVGYLSLAQFEVMASPGSAFRLSNAQAELDRAGVGRVGGLVLDMMV